MATEWNKVTDDVLQMAQELIRLYHPELMEFNIAFVFRSEAGLSGGKRVLGQASKAPAKFAPFMDLDGLVWLAEDVWYQMSETQKKALIDHELCHFIVGMDGSFGLRGHDIEEFQAVIDRWGLWDMDLRTIAPSFVAAQEKLPGFDFPGGVMALDPEMMGSKVDELELA